MSDPVENRPVVKVDCPCCGKRAFDFLAGR